MAIFLAFKSISLHSAIYLKVKIFPHTCVVDIVAISFLFG